MPRSTKVRQKEIAEVLSGVVDRLAMARAILVIRREDGTEEPVGALVSMENLARLQPGMAIERARGALAEAKLAAEDGKPAATQHLIACCEELLKLLGG